MFIPSLVAAMLIAGAFWGGVIAARRLRDWGESNRALEGGEPPLALAVASGVPSNDDSVKKVRAHVADRLQASLANGQGMAALAASHAPRDAAELDIDGLRVGDVVLIEALDGRAEGDFLVEGLLRLREGTVTTLVVIMADGERRRWLIGSLDTQEWLSVEPVEGHNLAGEPPRNIQPPDQPKVFALSRRGQASVAAIGSHGRPGQSRVSTYVYRAGSRDTLWLERWGATVLMGQGVTLPRHSVSFLPGS